jgi:hypothetical protein
MRIPPHEEALLDGLGAALGTLRTELERRMDARFAELEQAIPRFCGVYAAGRTYEPNSLVVKSGSLWISLARTTEPPGRSSWQLCVKQGEAGRGPGIA